MVRSVVLALLAAVAVVGGSQACTTGSGREDLAIQRFRLVLCEKARECGCYPEALDECGDWPPANDVYSAYDERYAFDASCAERWVSWAESLSCDDARTPSYADVCPLYHGAALEGQPCQTSIDFYVDDELPFSTCSPGLSCLAGTCRDISRTQLGADGQPCDQGGRCDTGLGCVEDACQRLPGPGEPCLAGFHCGGGAFCDLGVCRDLAGPGESCELTEGCKEGLLCTFDFDVQQSRCQLTGAVGDPCRGHRECLSGNCPAGFCAEPAGIGDPCGSQLPCGPGSSCDEGQCQASAGASTCGLLRVP